MIAFDKDEVIEIVPGKKTNFSLLRVIDIIHNGGSIAVLDCAYTPQQIEERWKKLTEELR